MAETQMVDGYSKHIDNLPDFVADKVFKLKAEDIRAMTQAQLQKLYEKRTAGKGEDEKKAIGIVLKLLSAPEGSQEYEHTIGKLTTYTSAYVPLQKLVKSGAITKEQSTAIMVKLVDGEFPAIRADPQYADIVNEMVGAIKFAHGLRREARETRSADKTADLLSFLGIRYGDEDLSYSVKYLKENGYGKQWDKALAEAKATVGRMNEEFFLSSTIQLAQNEALNLQTGRQYAENSNRAKEDGEKATDDYMEKKDAARPKPKKKP